MLLVLAFAGSELQAAPHPGTFTSPNFLQDASYFQAPLEHVSLKEVHTGNGAFIIHIQDAHSNFSGQESMALALDDLMKRYGVKLVLSEGGWDDCSLTPMKEIASSDVWKKVARRFLVSGELQGEEYLNLISDRPMKIVGIEDEALYAEGLESYRRLAEKREEVLAYLSQIERAVEKVKSRLYPKEFLRYEKVESIEERIQALAKMAGSPGNVSFGSFPDLEKLMLLAEKEASINHDAANLEMAVLAEELARRGATASLESHLETMLRTRGAAGKTAQFTYLRGMLEAARSHGIDAAKYANLNAYLGTLSDFSAVDLEAALQEIDRAEDAVYKAALPTEDAKLLRSIDRFARLLRSAHRIQMTADQFALFIHNEPDFSPEAMQAFLNRKLAELGYYEDLIPYEGLLGEGREALGAFYGSVKKRDHAFLRNVESAMKAEDQKVAVLISGGYHTPHLKELFRQKGWGYAVLAPNVTAETSQEKYEKLLLAEKKPSKKKTVTVSRDDVSARRGRGALEADLAKLVQKDSQQLRTLLARREAMNGIPGSRLAKLADAASKGSSDRLAEVLNGTLSPAPVGVRMAATAIPKEEVLRAGDVMHIVDYKDLSAGSAFKLGMGELRPTAWSFGSALEPKWVWTDRGMAWANLSDDKIAFIFDTRSLPSPISPRGSGTATLPVLSGGVSASPALTTVLYSGDDPTKEDELLREMSRINAERAAAGLSPVRTVRYSHGAARIVAPVLEASGTPSDGVRMAEMRVERSAGIQTQLPGRGQEDQAPSKTKERPVTSKSFVSTLDRLQAFYQLNGLPPATFRGYGIYRPSDLASVWTIWTSVELKPGQKVLDLGFGDGRVVVSAAMFGADAIGMDNNEELFIKGVALTDRALAQFPEMNFVKEVSSDSLVRWVRQDGRPGSVSLALANFENAKNGLDKMDVVFRHDHVGGIKPDSELGQRLESQMKDGSLLVQMQVISPALLSDRFSEVSSPVQGTRIQRAGARMALNATLAVSEPTTLRSEWLVKDGVRPDILDVATISDEELRRMMEEVGMDASAFEGSEAFAELSNILPYIQILSERISSEFTGHTVLALGRDAEIFHDSLRLMGYSQEQVRIFPGSKSFWMAMNSFSERDGDLREYLAGFGITAEAIRSGRKFLLLDSGFEGSVPRMIHEKLASLFGLPLEQVRMALPARMVSSEAFGQRPAYAPALMELGAAPIADTFPRSWKYAKGEAKRPFEHALAIAIQLLPHYHEKYVDIRRDPDGVVRAVTIPRDEKPSDVDTAQFFNESIVNPAAALLVQRRIAAYFQGAGARLAEGSSLLEGMAAAVRAQEALVSRLRSELIIAENKYDNAPNAAAQARLQKELDEADRKWTEAAAKLGQMRAGLEIARNASGRAREARGGRLSTFNDLRRYVAMLRSDGRMTKETETPKGSVLKARILDIEERDDLYGLLIVDTPQGQRVHVNSSPRIDDQPVESTLEPVGALFRDAGEPNSLVAIEVNGHQQIVTREIYDRWFGARLATNLQERSTFRVARESAKPRGLFRRLFWPVLLTVNLAIAIHVSHYLIPQFLPWNQALLDMRQAASEKSFSTKEYRFEIVPYSSSIDKKSIVSNLNPFRDTGEGWFPTHVPIGYLASQKDGKRIVESRFNPNSNDRAGMKVVVLVKDGRFTFYRTAELTEAKIKSIDHDLGFQAGPEAVRNGVINQAIWDWYEKLAEGRVRALGTDASGNVHVQDFFGADIFGGEGKPVEEFKKDFEAWVSEHGVIDAVWVDAGVVGFVPLVDPVKPTHLMIAIPKDDAPLEASRGARFAQVDEETLRAIEEETTRLSSGDIAKELRITPLEPSTRTAIQRWLEAAREGDTHDAERAYEEVETAIEANIDQRAQYISRIQYRERALADRWRTAATQVRSLALEIKVVQRRMGESPIKADRRSRNEADDMLRRDKQAREHQFDMSKLGLRNDFYGPRAGDIFVLDMLRTARRVFESKGGKFYRKSLGSDESTGVLPGSAAKERGQDLVAEINGAVRHLYATQRLFVSLPAGLSADQLRSISQLPETLSIDHLPTGMETMQPFAMFQIKEGSDPDAALAVLMAKSGIPDLGPGVVTRMKVLPPRIQEAETQDEQKKGAKAKGRLLAKDEAVSLRREMEDIRGTLLAQETRAHLDLETDFPAYDYHSLPAILHEAATDDTGDPKIYVVRRAPDNFYLISSNGLRDFQIVLVRHAYSSIFDGTLRKFYESRRESLRSEGMEPSSDIVRSGEKARFGFKQINGVFGHAIGDEAIALNLVTLVREFQRALRQGDLLTREQVFAMLSAEKERFNHQTMVAERFRDNGTLGIGGTIVEPTAYILDSRDLLEKMEPSTILRLLDVMGQARRRKEQEESMETLRRTPFIVHQSKENPGTAVMNYQDNRHLMGEMESNYLAARWYRRSRAWGKLQREADASTGAGSRLAAKANPVLAIRTIAGETESQALYRQWIADGSEALKTAVTAIEAKSDGPGQGLVAYFDLKAYPARSASVYLVVEGDRLSHFHLWFDEETGFGFPEALRGDVGRELVARIFHWLKEQGAQTALIPLLLESGRKQRSRDFFMDVMDAVSVEEGRYSFVDIVGNDVPLSSPLFRDDDSDIFLKFSFASVDLSKGGARLAQSSGPAISPVPVEVPRGERAVYPLNVSASKLGDQPLTMDRLTRDDRRVIARIVNANAGVRLSAMSFAGGAVAGGILVLPNTTQVALFATPGGARIDTIDVAEDAARLKEEAWRGTDSVPAAPSAELQESMVRRATAQAAGDLRLGLKVLPTVGEGNVIIMKKIDTSYSEAEQVREVLLARSLFGKNVYFEFYDRRTNARLNELSDPVAILPADAERVLSGEPTAAELRQAAENGWRFVPVEPVDLHDGEMGLVPMASVFLAAVIVGRTDSIHGNDTATQFLRRITRTRMTQEQYHGFIRPNPDEPEFYSEYSVKTIVRIAVNRMLEGARMAMSAVGSAA